MAHAGCPPPVRVRADDYSLIWPPPWLCPQGGPQLHPLPLGDPPREAIDPKLQQVIRDNLFLRTIPHTTRVSRDGEAPGLDSTIEQHKALEENGALLESGKDVGNFYGTLNPPVEPTPFQPYLFDQVLFNNEFDTESQRKRTTSVSKMERGTALFLKRKKMKARKLLMAEEMRKKRERHSRSSDWMKTVLSCNQTSMDFRNFMKK